MADRRYSREYRSDRRRESYPYSVDGNTVRRLDAVPRRREEEHRREEERKRRKLRRRIKTQPVHLPGMEFSSLVFLMATAAVIFLACFAYIQVQNRVHKQKNQIVELESSIALQRESNDIAYQAVIDSVDLSDVYKKATKKLGMVQAKKNQIYSYKSKKSDTVKQYGEIPDAR